MRAADRPDNGTDIETRLAISKAFGALLFLGLVIGTAFPNFIFKDLSGFLLLAIALTACAVSPALRTAAQFQTPYLILSTCFVGLGALIILLSAAEMYQTDAELPLRKDYILRHAYFLFFWIPFLFGASGFWNSCFWSVESVCRRFGPILLVGMAVADFSTSRFFGNVRTVEWVGYSFYLEKFTFQFLFGLVFVIFVLRTGRWLIGLTIISFYLVLCLSLKLGIMFNAFTGELAFLILFIAVFPFPSARVKILLLVTLLMFLWLFAVFGLFFPDYFSGDENNHWRLMVWRNNLKSMWDSYLLGVGFGTPYHPLTTQNLINTMRNSFDSVSVALTDPIEPQYVRGQHSSFINIFYRMGVVGGLVFITLSLTPIVFAVRQSFRRGRSDGGLLLASVALYVLQLVQMTVHVGIEAPRFLVSYMLSAQFVLNACTREQLD